MQKIAVLYDASQAVLSTFDLDEVLNQILGIARDYFHLHNVAILLLDSDTKELCVRSQVGWDEGQDKIKVLVGQGITGTAARLKRPVYVPDVSKDARYLKSAQSTRSELAVPLMVRDEVVGVLDCQSDRINFFDSETIDLLTLFSTQASMALQNARLYSLEQRRSAQLEAINAIAKQTTAVLELEELLTKLCFLVRQSFPADHVCVLLKDENALVLRSHEGKLTLLISEQERIPAGDSIAWRAIGTNKTIIESDIRKAGHYLPIFRETRSRMCIPLISFGQTLGVLMLDSAQEGAFTLADAQTLESVADICATAIQNTHYVQRVRQLAYIDGLTGMFNRRFFEIRIAEEMERAQRHNGTLAVIMMDIDHFKRLNDEFGHLLGDEVLRQISSVFSLQLRKSDVVCRYGGEEFAIVLPQITAEQALSVAEKLRREVAGWHFPGVPRSVTISAGTAAFPLHGQTRDDIVKAADAALYAAKQAGRNCVRAAGLAPATA
ncbi:MAG TPA: sensor domain-containing diguanylate cyclase [Terriglobales bacterium]|nr:sensor domain-containing diguanylate cyclase [Terriglobales bacterium]